MSRTRVVGLVILCAAAVFCEGCAKKAPQATYAAPPSHTPDDVLPPSLPPAPDPSPLNVGLTEEEIFAQKTLAELNAERPLGDVLFGLDQSAIRDDARAVLQKNADWMLRWTSTRITVEGHCDARGTSEYNLALGDRRAAAVKDYLVSLGVERDRVSVVSKGKEAQVCTEENERCWQRNRRGHPIITAK
jgi:peptidoglycan-associated lipoprotein